MLAMNIWLDRNSIKKSWKSMQSVRFMNIYYPESFEMIGRFKSCVKQGKTRQSRDLLVPIFVYCSTFPLFWSDIVVVLYSKWFSVVSTSNVINHLSLECYVTSPNQADLWIAHHALSGHEMKRRHCWCNDAEMNVRKTWWRTNMHNHELTCKTHGAQYSRRRRSRPTGWLTRAYTGPWPLESVAPST